MENDVQSPESLSNLSNRRVDRKVNLKDERARFSTFTNWPVTFISPAALARTGFYYLGTEDAVKCAFCNGIIAQWEIGDEPKTEHRKFFPKCPKLLDEVEENDDCGIEYGQPKVQNYATLDSRIRSFKDWQYSDIQKPDVLAKAGFFFLGQSDEVRCFYCDGGLRFWQKEDDPFFEHARYFQKCGFVRLVKGKDYINKVLEEVLEKQVEEQKKADQARPPQQTIEDAINSEVFRQALQIGLDFGKIKMVSQEKLNKTGTIYSNIENLIEDVLEGQTQDEGLSDTQLENQVNRLLLSAVTSEQLYTEEANQPSTSKPKNTEKSKLEDQKSSEESKLSLEEENKKLKSFRECKICMTNEVEVVLVPCGHLLSCTLCSVVLENCPLCRTAVKGRIRTFLS